MDYRFDIYDRDGRLLYKNVSLPQTAAILELDDFEVSSMVEEHGRIDVDGLTAIPTGEDFNA